MQERDDYSLLREYAEHASEQAFAELVTRHVNKVYSVALRHTGNPHQAEEITQAVFVILAKKSRGLRRGVILSGWLYETARLTSVTFLRSEIRRTRREQEAHMQKLANESDDGVWSQIVPLLDEALEALNEGERHAVVLRFFDQKSLKEVGQAVGASEDAAKKRVTRAVEKLRKYFSRRGVNSTTTVIATALSANSVQAAPAGLAKAAVSVAIAKNAALGSSTLIKGALKVMFWTKAKTTVVLGIGALLVSAGAYEAHQASQLSGQNKILQQQQSLLTEQMQKLQSERDDAANQLALAVDSQAQNQKEHSELLRLRGEEPQMESLRQQLAQLKSTPSAPAEAAIDVSGPNKVLYDFLGEPASPPPDMNPAWSKAGLIEGVQAAAENAGITLKKIEIDDSEFPYLIGVVCDTGDFEKLKAQIKKNPDYDYSGSVGGDNCNAFNITPYRAYSGQAGVNINRRMTVRESMLYNKISGQQ